MTSEQVRRAEVELLEGVAVVRGDEGGQGGVTGGESDDFSVDKQRQQRELASIDAHLQAGGALGFCPEGTVSKAPPHLQPFRRGSFAWATQHQMQMWGIVMLGNHECWPKRCALGGYPTTIYLGFAPLGTADAAASNEAVADACRKGMQVKLDELIKARDGGKAELV